MNRARFWACAFLLIACGCTFLGLDDVDARSCGGGSLFEQNQRCAHLNNRSETRSANTCQTWQCLGPDNRRRCGLALRDDDGDGVPAAICAMDLPEERRDCNDSPIATDDAGIGSDNRPGNTETCDGLDQNCDGVADDGVDFSRRNTGQNVVTSLASLPAYATRGGKVVALQRAVDGRVAVQAMELTTPPTGPAVPNTSSLSVFAYAGDDRAMAVGGSPTGDRWLFASTSAQSRELVFSWSVGSAVPMTIRTAGATDAGVDARVDGGTDAAIDAGAGDSSAGDSSVGNAAVAKALTIVGAEACGSRTFAVGYVARSAAGTSCESGTVRFRAVRVPVGSSGSTFGATFGEAEGPQTIDRAGPQMLALPSEESATRSRFLVFTSIASGVEVGLLETSELGCTASSGSLSYTRVDTIAADQPMDVQATWAGSAGTESRIALAFRNGDCTAGDMLSVRLLAWNDSARTLTATRMTDFPASGTRSVALAWLDGRQEAVVGWYSLAGDGFAIRARRVSELAGAIAGDLAFAPSDPSAAAPTTGAGRLYFASAGESVEGVLLTQINNVSTFIRLSAGACE